jgi:uncharacterized protein (TIGR02246 family)
MGDELEERIRNLEDRTALWELVNRYGMAVDDQDYDVLLRLFADDAAFIGLNGEQTKGGAAVVDYLRSRADTAHKSRVHTPTAQVLDQLDAERAAGLVTCYAGLFGHDDSTAFFAFRYKDEYVHRDGRWLFQSRQVHAVTHIIND